DLAEVAVELVMHALKAPEALDNAGALLAEQLPVHFEEAKGSSVQEEIDDLGLLQVLLAGEGEGVDAEQPLVIGGADMAFEFGNQTGGPALRLLELGKALVQQLLVHRGGHGALLSTPKHRVGLAFTRWVGARLAPQGAGGARTCPAADGRNRPPPAPTQDWRGGGCGG